MSSLDDPRWILWKRVHRWRRDALNRLHSRRFLVSRTFSFLTPPRFNSLFRITVKLFPCVAPCREHMISTWQFYEVDQVISRLIGERSTKIKMIMHDAHDLFAILVTARYLSLHTLSFWSVHFYFVFLFCILFFFFFYFFFRLEFLLRIIIIIIEMYFFRIIIWLFISVGFTLLYDYLTYDNLW